MPKAEPNRLRGSCSSIPAISYSPISLREDLKRLEYL